MKETFEFYEKIEPAARVAMEELGTLPRNHQYLILNFLAQNHFSEAVRVYQLATGADLTLAYSEIVKIRTYLTIIQAEYCMGIAS